MGWKHETSAPATYCASRSVFPLFVCCLLFGVWTHTNTPHSLIRFPIPKPSALLCTLSSVLCVLVLGSRGGCTVRGRVAAVSLRPSSVIRYRRYTELH